MAIESPFKKYSDEQERLQKERRKQIIVDYLPMVKYIAIRIHNRLPANIELDDLISYGIIGLIDAVKRYNPSKKAEFKTYAEYRIRGSILDELRAKDWVPRSVRDKAKLVEEAYQKLEHELQRSPTEKEIAGYMKLTIEEYHQLLNSIKSISILSFEDLFKTNEEGSKPSGSEHIKDTSTIDPVEEVQKQEIKQIIKDVLSEMNEKEKTVISFYYFEEMTFKEIANIMSVTESYVSQIHTQAMIRLKVKLKKRAIENSKVFVDSQ